HRREAVGADVVRNAEVLAAQSIEEVAGDGLARRKADAVHEAVELRPGGGQVLEQLVDLRVVADVAIEDQLRAELSREFGDALLEALANVAEREFRSLLAAAFRD